MTVFAGTNGAGKSTISFQLRYYVGTIIDPDQIAKRINPEDPRSADLSAGLRSCKANKGTNRTKRKLRYRNYSIGKFCFTSYEDS